MCPPGKMCPADTFSWEILTMGHIFLGNSVLLDRIYCPSSDNVSTNDF